jgi:hypothetical protein
MIELLRGTDYCSISTSVDMSVESEVVSVVLESKEKRDGVRSFVFVM